MCDLLAITQAHTICSGHCRKLRRLLGPDGSVYHSTLLSLLKELHRIWADLKTKGNMLDPTETGLLHTALVAFVCHLPVPLTEERVGNFMGRCNYEIIVK